MPVRYILSSVWVKLSIFSQLSIIQYVGLCVFSLPISLVMLERIYILCLIIIIKSSEVWTITHCLGLGHVLEIGPWINNPIPLLYMVAFYVFMAYTQSWFICYQTSTLLSDNLTKAAFACPSLGQSTNSNVLPLMWKHYIIVSVAFTLNGFLLRSLLQHDDVIKWKHFPRNWPFVRGIHRSTVNSPHKDQWRGALMFSLICARINGWVNNREAGDLRRHRGHYDVIVMKVDMDHWSNMFSLECDDPSKP